MAGIELEIGTILGGEFRVVRPLRVGGMGAVYVAEQRSTGAQRALKVMQRELVADPSLRERFEQEARVGALIESDHVVQVIGAGVDEARGLPWIAMELLEGIPLDLYLAQKGPRSPSEVRFLFEQLCHALSLAHARGIVHRDLKPANVFLCRSRVVGLSYVVKVLDFGIAKVLAEAKTARTAAVGTPLYMAPEQYDGGTVTPATDVWALGLIAFELLTGRSYWKTAGSDATPAKIMYETCIGELVPASGRATDLGLHAPFPQGFDAWFARCLERRPADRFVDAGAAFFLLKEILGPSAPPSEPLPSAVGNGAQGATKSMSLRSDPGPPTSVTPAPTRGVGSAPVEETVLARTEPRATGSTAAERARASWPMLLGAALGALVVVMLGVRMMRPSALDKAPAPSASTSAVGPASTSAAPLVTTPHRFIESGTLGVDARTLHSKIPPGLRTETYVMLDLHGADREGAAAPAKVHLALVIDRSGSMKGGRLDSAIAAAKTAIGRLRDGDEVTVIAFDQNATTIVPPTQLASGTRVAALAAVAKLTLGGDTCISCGLSLALEKLGTSREGMRRIMLLSDGEANVGIKDLAGFEKIARDAQKINVSVTTVGVGYDYDPKALTAIARESNGRHYYAESDASLPAIFDAEAKAMASVVASNVEATLRLAPGVQLVRVLDRAHRIEGASVRVPLGQIARDEHKTVLLQVSILPGTDDIAPVCTVEVQLEDLISGGGVARIRGELALAVGSEQEPTDPVVETRVQRSETAAALLHANDLFARGQAKAAAAVLGKQSQALAAQKTKIASKPQTQNPYLGKDIDAQASAVAAAEKSYGGVPPMATVAAPGQAPFPPSGASPSPPAAAAPPAKKAAAKAADDAFKMGY